MSPGLAQGQGVDLKLLHKSSKLVGGRVQNCPRALNKRYSVAGGAPRLRRGEGCKSTKLEGEGHSDKVQLKPEVQNQKKRGAAPRARSVPGPYGAVAKMPSLESAGLESEPSSFVH